MNVGAAVFMLATWTGIVALTVYCFWKFMHAPSKK